MYSSVSLLWATTSGSPPVFSNSLRDQSFSGWDSSLAWIGGHVSSLWRWGCFSKRDFRVARSCLVCWEDRDFLGGMARMVALEGGKGKMEIGKKRSKERIGGSKNQ